ncbi:MAG: alpha/beta fold hydrolase [Haloarculaceae archaeon]
MATAPTNGIETYYQRQGSGPPIIFIHGAVLDHAQWDRQAEALADDHTTVAYDVRGHGRTGGSPRAPYSIDLFADDLDALITELDLDRPVLVGLSMGGLVAQVYAARHPERVGGLVLAGTFTPAFTGVRERFQRSLALRATIPFVRLFGYERIERAMVWAYERFSTTGASGDYETIERLRAEGPTMATAEFAKVMRAVALFHRVKVDYAAIAVPVRILYGENEPPFVREQADMLASALADAEVREIPGAGHASNLDAPEQFTGAVRDLLERAEQAERERGADAGSTGVDGG